jgi:hypothetical protein
VAAAACACDDKHQSVRRRHSGDTRTSGVRGSAPLGRVAFAGAIIGVGAMAMSLVTMAAASSNGASVDPTVARSVTTGAAGPFMVAAMGFAAFLMAAGLVTLRTGVFARWTGIIAIIGGGVIPRHVPRRPLLLRVLSRRRGARDVDGRRERQHTPLDRDLRASHYTWPRPGSAVAITTGREFAPGQPLSSPQGLWSGTAFANVP